MTGPIELRVRKPDGWTTISFPEDVECLGLAAGKVDGQLCFTLTGKRSDVPHVVETGILDVDEEDEEKIANGVPRTDNGESIMLARLGP